MIRQGTIEDVPAIVEMSREFWKHTQFDEEFDPEHVAVMVCMCIDHNLLLVIDNGEIDGFICAVKSFLLGSRKAQTATELAWWVNPSKRGKMLGVQLISALERLCIEQDVKYLNMAYMETSMPERVRDMYISLGYKLEETIYTKVLYGSGNSSSCNSGVSRIRRVLSKPGS